MIYGDSETSPRNLSVGGDHGEDSLIMTINSGGLGEVAEEAGQASLWMVSSVSTENLLIFLKVNEHIVKCQLDCGAACNVIRQEELPGFRIGGN